MRCRTLPVTYMLLLGSYYQIESHIFSLHRWKLNKKSGFLNLLQYYHNYSEDRRIHMLHAYICNRQERKPLVRHCDNKKQHDYGKYYVNLWLHTRTQSKIHLCSKYIHIQIFFYGWVLVLYRAIWSETGCPQILGIQNSRFLRSVLE